MGICLAMGNGCVWVGSVPGGVPGGVPGSVPGSVPGVWGAAMLGYMGVG